jgi:hypothetical protein
MYRLLAWLAAVLLAISSIKIQSDWFLNWFFFSASLTTVIAQIQYQNKETISESKQTNLFYFCSANVYNYWCVCCH